jgi:hypothetical protein
MSAHYLAKDEQEGLACPEVTYELSILVSRTFRC